LRIGDVEFAVPVQEMLRLYEKNLKRRQEWVRSNAIDALWAKSGLTRRKRDSAPANRGL
jgi:hypothetical protein